MRVAHSERQRKDRFEQPALTPRSDRPRPYFVSPHRAHCPNNHRLQDTTLVLEDTVYRCDYKYPAAGGRGYDGECGALMLLIAGFHSRKGEPLILIAPVTPADIRYMQERRMTVEEELAFIGLGPPPAR
jgi:hypothetical protein